MNEDGTRIIAPSATPSAAPGADAGSLIGPGVLVANTYVIDRRLGGGGMGEVFLARHASLKTEHAIKMIRPSMVENTLVMDLFYREARVLRNVRHDAVVNYDGFMRDDQGREFLVMEYVEGRSLSDLVKGVPCDPADVLTLRERLCAGLAEAHRRGAVHRDLSPDNVILPGGRFEAAKLIDFGLCKLTDPGQETIVGDSFAGKYRYASPEQFGLYGGKVDARSDIYSLGLVLAAAARGRPLAMGESFAAALASRQQVPDLSQVPPALRDWLCAMLQPDPADRPADIPAFLARWPARAVLVEPGDAPAAAPAVEPSHPPVGAPASIPPTATPPRRRLGPVLGLTLLGGAAVGGGLYWTLRPLPLPQSVPAPAAGPALSQVAPDPGVALRAPPAPPPDLAPDAGAPSRVALSGEIAAVLRSFECPALAASALVGGALVITGQVRSGEKANLYERLSGFHPAGVDVTAVTAQPWPRCALAGAIAARMPQSAARNAPRILLSRDKTSFKLGERLDIRIQSNTPREGRISLTYVDSGGEAFHILPYPGEADAIPARGTLVIAPVVAEPPIGPALLVATWCSDALYRQPPPEKEPVDQFHSRLIAALDARGADCTTSLLDLEVRPR